MRERRRLDRLPPGCDYADPDQVRADLYASGDGRSAVRRWSVRSCSGHGGRDGRPARAVPHWAQRLLRAVVFDSSWAWVALACLLADAVRNQRTWLTDFDDDPVTISTDLYEVILAYQHYRRPSA